MIGSKSNSPEKSVKEQAWYKAYAEAMKTANKEGWHAQPDPGQGKILSLKEADELRAKPDQAKVAEEAAYEATKEAGKETVNADPYPSCEVPSSGSYACAPMVSSGTYPELWAAITSGAVYSASGTAASGNITSAAAVSGTAASGNITSAAAVSGTAASGIAASGSYGAYVWSENTASGSGAYIWNEATSGYGSWSSSGSGSGSGSGILGYGLGLI